MELTAIIEALLIASEQPLSSAELARLVRARVAEAEEAISGSNEELKNKADHTTLPDELSQLAATSEAKITATIAELNQSYDQQDRAFTILDRTKGWKIFTKPAYADFVRMLFPGQKPQRLSGPAMETLAIIAYRQPITKAAMEAVRGVSCDGMVQKLLDRELICIGGRAELPGRPLLYTTTDTFFEYFGIKSIDDLPNVAELRTIKLPEPEIATDEAKQDTLSSTSKIDTAKKNDFDSASIEQQAIDLTKENSNNE